MSSSAGSSPNSTRGDGNAPGVAEHDELSTAAATMGGQDATAANEPPQRPRISPPKKFVCFVCGKPYNERDYQRHIQGFEKKAKRAMAGVFKTKKGNCPGIMHMSHPILKRFPGETLDQRVKQMCSDLCGLCHGGALDALSAEGSGRHIDVNARVQWLMSDDPFL